VVGVIPFLPELRLAQEDSEGLDAQEPGKKSQGAPLLDIAVIRFPHLSNFDDMDALGLEEGVGLRYVRRREDLGRPAALILPGTKSTLDDLRWLRDRGLDGAIAAALKSGTSVVGLCGGYQMLGRSIQDTAGIDGTKKAGARPGLGYLPVETDFVPGKTTRLVRGRVLPALGPLESAAGMEVEGYEIHAGRSRYLEGAAPLIELGNGNLDGGFSFGGRVWGSYLHGLFDRPEFRRAWLRGLGRQTRGKGLHLKEFRERELDRLADFFESNIDMAELRGIIGL
jgi:adenosylcobyric acid synthase